jgi:hypothetical protein
MKILSRRLDVGSLDGPAPLRILRVPFHPVKLWSATRQWSPATPSGPRGRCEHSSARPGRQGVMLNSDDLISN